MTSIASVDRAADLISTKLATTGLGLCGLFDEGRPRGRGGGFTLASWSSLYFHFFSVWMLTPIVSANAAAVSRLLRNSPIRFSQNALSTVLRAIAGEKDRFSSPCH